MFESAELGNKVTKETYHQEVPALRAALLEAQRQLAAADFSVVVVVDGAAGAGKSEVVNLLLEWLDARGIQTHALDGLSDEEREHPPMWRFWRRLPPAGCMAVFYGSWDRGPFYDRVFGRIPRDTFDLSLDKVVDLERMLAREKVLLVKFWLHLSRKAQKKRLRKLEADPATRWRVTRRDWRLYRRYKAFRSTSEHLLRRTNTADSPWTIVEAAQSRYRNLTVARGLLNALRARLDAAHQEPAPTPPQPVQLTPAPVNVLRALDLSLALDEDEYRRELPHLQGELAELMRKLRPSERSLLLVFEGPDAAGKGGAIRRLTAAMDARDYRVISVSAPTDEERAHPYLWRFWRHLPGWGRATLYDRSWYGRVLVERVEGFARPDEWQRAYEEINSFEEQLTDFGVVLIKFWLAISPDEQLRRFRSRQQTPYKQYKITPEDWRNRARWDSYEAAACDMLERCSTEEAPWVLVEAENKEWARVKVLRTVVERLRSALE